MTKSTACKQIQTTQQRTQTNKKELDALSPILRSTNEKPFLQNYRTCRNNCKTDKSYKTMQIKQTKAKEEQSNPNNNRTVQKHMNYDK